MPNQGQTSTGERYRKINEHPLGGLSGDFHGVIQHSFALQLPRDREFRETSGWLPIRSRQVKSSTSFSARQRKYHRHAHEQLVSLFEDPTKAFDFRFPAQLADPAGATAAAPTAGGYSWLLGEACTRVDPQPLAVLQADDRGERLPNPLAWAEEELQGSGGPQRGWDGAIFAQRERSWFTSAPEDPVANDLLLEETGASGESELEVSRVLFQLWAHWRSRLFGVSLASRFFNVFLPHAILSPSSAPGAAYDESAVTGCSPPAGPLIVQPFVSLVREPDRSQCRRTFTFTVLFIPVLGGSDGAEARQRTMSLREIEAGVRGAWGLAANRIGANRQQFALDGPLRRYCANVGYELPEGELAIRHWVEAMIFATTKLRRDRLRHWWHPRRVLDDEDLGDRVLTSLASSRVSAVTVVDSHLQREQVREWHEIDSTLEDGALFPGDLPNLARAVSGRIYLARMPSYRVDRPFLDRDSYANVVVPVARSLITTTTRDSQLRYYESGLFQSVVSGYMALGAATAQALIRNSYHEIEAHSDPKQFGEISKEFTRDFHEIYDLDIVWESYKRTYRSILEQFEIMHDYEALRRKVDMLFNTTVAEFTEWQHTRLWFVTWLLVIVAIATIVVQVVK